MIEISIDSLNELSQTVQKAQSGDTQALRALIEHAIPVVRYIALKIVGQIEDAEDVAQEVSTIIVQRIQELRSPQAFNKWVYTIAKHEAIRLLRQNRKVFTDNKLFDLKSDSQILDVTSNEQKTLDFYYKVADEFLFDTPVWLRGFWHQCNSLKITEQSMIYLREFARCVLQYKKVHWLPVFSGKMRAPKGSLIHAANILNIKPQTIKKHLYRTRSRIFANLFLLSVKLGDFTTLQTFFHNFMMKTWRGGGVGILLGSRPEIETFCKDMTGAIREFSEELVKDIPGNLNLLKTGKADFLRVLPLFFETYNDIKLVSLFNPELGAECLSGIEINTISPGQSLNINEYMFRRMVVRGRHLVGNRGWLQEWCKELQSYFESPNNLALMFGAYEGLYFANRLDRESWGRLVSPESLDVAWSAPVMESVVGETWNNLREEWYRKNPYHRAANLLRIALYFRLYRNFSFVPVSQRKCLFDIANDYLRSGFGKVANVNMDAVAKWIINEFPPSL